MRNLAGIVGARKPKDRLHGLPAIVQGPLQLPGQREAKASPSIGRKQGCRPHVPAALIPSQVETDLDAHGLLPGIDDVGDLEVEVSRRIGRNQGNGSHRVVHGQLDGGAGGLPVAGTG